MILNGTVTKTTQRTVTFKGDVKVNQTVDNPAQKRVQVSLNNNFTTTIEGADYDALAADWSTDDDLLAFIAKKNNLSIA